LYNLWFVFFEAAKIFIFFLQSVKQAGKNYPFIGRILPVFFSDSSFLGNIGHQGNRIKIFRFLPLVGMTLLNWLE